MVSAFIIGAMGSGKSSVLKAFSAWGAETLNLDTVGHEILKNPQLKAKLVSAFGQSILGEKGEVNRATLAKSAFANSASAEKLSCLTAPYLVQELRFWLFEQEKKGTALAAVEVSAYRGNAEPFVDIADFVVAVLAPKGECAKRATLSGFEIDDVERRLKVQPSNKERRAWADFVIENTGSASELHAQARSVFESLLAQG
jgi:dephospho-CoA kinase